MKKKKKPFGFCARQKPFTVQIDGPCQVTGYSTADDRHAAFYRPVPVKKGDVFRAVIGKGIVLNGKLVERRARPLKKIVWKVSWVAKRLRVAVFQERDPIWSKRLKRHTKKLGKPYWTACDLRSYHVGCGDTPVEAMKALLAQCQATHLIAEEEKAKGNRVIRWRCLLPENEMREMEAKAKKTGFVIDGVEVPAFPKRWQEGLERLRKKRRA